MAAPSWTDIPIPDETADLRDGPDLHPSLLPLLPLVGTWRGTGKGGYPTIEDFDYGQQVTFAHDGRAGAAVRVARLDPGRRTAPCCAPAPGRPAGGGPARDRTSWRCCWPTPPASSRCTWAARPATTQWELTTDVVARTATAKEVTANHRLYGIVDGALLYAMDMAAMGQPLQPHLSARLERVGG